MASTAPRQFGSRLPIEPKGPMRLEELTLRNFKGIPNFSCKFAGQDAGIYGRNALGKTTIADAIFWLLFDKDSRNQKEFDIKTFDPENPGEPLHGMEHSVYAVFSLDGDHIAFEKTFREDWVKKRGGSKSEFSGHTTEYKVNGVPVQKKEYDSWLAGICEEKVFRLLSDPTFFSVHLHWQERRKLLLEICGDVSDADVIASNPKLVGLSEVLGRHSIEDFRKIVVARRKELNSEIEKIPIRIDELTRSMPPASSAPPKELKQLRADLEAVNERRALLSAGGEVAEKRIQLREVESEILEAANRALMRAMDGQAPAIKAHADAAAAVSDCRRQIQSAEQNLSHDEPALARLAEQLAALRRRYLEENSKVFAFTGSETCAACGQALPADKVQEAIAKAEALFNETKARNVEANKAEGRALRQRHDDLAALVNEQKEKLAAAKQRLDGLVAAEADLKAKASSAPANDAQDPEYTALIAKREQLSAELAALQESSADALESIDAEAKTLTAAIMEAERAASESEARERSKQRVEDLKVLERDYAAEIERAEEQLFLTEEFIRTKVAALEAKINGAFQLAQFKLFETQVNGGLTECCEATIEGRPFSSALSNSERINVGLDIINVLARHYGFAPVIVVDNCEGVTDPLPTTGQQIRLVVSKPDDQLRVALEAA